MLDSDFNKRGGATMRLQTGERGFVSLLTCIFISFLLVIIATSLISIETLQLRKAEDAEQSLRAYYIAEAGVEDAVAKVLSGTTFAPGCNPNTTFEAGGNGWTCQQVNYTGSPAGDLKDQDKAVTIDPGRPSPDYKSAIVEWQQSGNATGYNVNLSSGFPCDSSDPSCSVGGYNYSAPPMEVAVVAYPTGNFEAGDPGLTLQNALIVPGGTGPTGMVNYSNGAGFPNHGVYKANCAPLGRNLPVAIDNGAALNYNCYAVIENLLPGSDYLFRIRTRYMPAQYQVIFMTGTAGDGNVVPVPTGMAQIDVTARAGQTYRRVISQLPLNQSAAAELNYVIYSDKDICKSFYLIDNKNPTGCPY